MAKGKGVLSSLKAVFGGRTTPPAPPVNRPMKGEEDHWVALSLDQMLVAEPDLPVHVVTLREYRLALGTNWAKLESKVMLLAESAIRRVTRHGGVVVQKGDSFIIVFKLPFRANGAKHTHAAAIELGQRLVGANFSIGKERGPSIAVAELRAADLLGEDGTISPAKLAVAAETARPLALPPPQTSAATPGQRQEAASDVPATQAAAAASSAETRTTPRSTDWKPMEATKGQTTEITLVPLDPPKKKRPDPQWLPISKDK